MTTHNSTKVPAEGEVGARIMIVGEAPGADEEEEGRPFIGRSGQLLMRYLGRHRILRSDVYLTNLCKYRPKKNDFTKLLGSDVLDEGLEELREEIARVQPNLIVACGNWPMYYLTGQTAEKGKPGTGIQSWRGSVMPCTLVEGYKVLITYHPAFIVRPQGFAMNPIFNFDLSKIPREAATRNLQHPVFEAIVDPPDLEHFVGLLEKSSLVSCDIETFGEQVACVGYASTTEWGLCITHEGDLEAARWLWQRAPLVFQFGTFDINYMRFYYDWQIGAGQYRWDTYIAAATLMPEFPRGLDFLTSIYTPFPYYKTERKKWKDDGDLSTLWQYNVKDVIATLMIANEQRKEIAEIWKPSLDSQSSLSSLSGASSNGS